MDASIYISMGVYHDISKIEQDFRSKLWLFLLCWPATRMPTERVPGLSTQANDRFGVIKNRVTESYGHKYLLCLLNDWLRHPQATASAKQEKLFSRQILASSRNLIL